MVFKDIKKTWKYLCFFIRVKKKWSRPRQSDVLIYDACGQEILLEYLNPWHPEVLHTRGEQINLQVLFFSIFRGGSIIDAYTDCFIEEVRPRLLVTLTDNAVVFYAISKRHPEVKTLLVQNGRRVGSSDVFGYLKMTGLDVFSNYFVDYMLVFGSAIAEKYAQYIKGNIVLMGSIRNNFVRKEKLPERGVMAFVSSYSPEGYYLVDGVFVSIEDFEWKPERLIIQGLLRYAKEKNKRLMIIPRHHKGDDLRAAEEIYFRDFLGSAPEYLESEGPYSGYRAVDSAEITVAVDSTLAHESIARGNKTAIFSIRGTLLGISGWDYGWPGDFPDEGLFWTNNPDPDSFVRILDYLFKVDDEQWKKDVEATNFSSVMVYDPENSIIKETLERVLGAAQAPEFYP